MLLDPCLPSIQAQRDIDFKATIQGMIHLLTYSASMQLVSIQIEKSFIKESFCPVSECSFEWK